MNFLKISQLHCSSFSLLQVVFSIVAVVLLQETAIAINEITLIYSKGKIESVNMCSLFLLITNNPISLVARVVSI